MIVRGFFYLVTKDGDDGTIKKGDIIQQLYGDTILSRRAPSEWIVPDNPEEAMKGVEYEVMT
jgi:hypothetical protein